MTDYFLDSSALIKRYVPEPGTAWVQSIARPSAGNQISVAQITQIEVISGVARRRREGRLLVRTAGFIRLVVDQHASNEYSIIGLNDEIVLRAENLVEAYVLRAYDAVQLASALEVNARLISNGLQRVIFVSADRRLLGAASSEGLATEDPNLHT